MVTEVTTTEEAIFLNFLCLYIPASSSHLCSTGSTGGGAGGGGAGVGLVDVGRLEADEEELLDLDEVFSWKFLDFLPEKQNVIFKSLGCASHF